MPDVVVGHYVATAHHAVGYRMCFGVLCYLLRCTVCCAVALTTDFLPRAPQPIRVVQMAGNGDRARSCAFSPNGEHLAVGMYSGGLKILEFHPQIQQVSQQYDFMSQQDLPYVGT